MTRRSPPQVQTDDRHFPLRLYILVPRDGFGALYDPSNADAIFAWLDRELGRGNYAWHSGGKFWGPNGEPRDRVAAYFRHPEDALSLLRAYPSLEIADGTVSATYSSPSLPFGRR